MTITVTFLDEAVRVAEVRIVPGRIGRLLGRQERELRSVQGAGGRWLDDASGRRVTDRRVIGALERARVATVGATRGVQ